VNWKNSPHRYSSASIVLHWIMAALVIGAYATAELRETFADGSTQQSLLASAHALIGLAVFVLVFARLALRSGPKPSITPAPSRVQAGLATAMHVTLYAFMIAMPLLGWLLVSADGTAVQLGGFQLPALVSPDHRLAEMAEETRNRRYDRLRTRRCACPRRPPPPLSGPRRHPGADAAASVAAPLSADRKAALSAGRARQHQGRTSQDMP